MEVVGGLTQTTKMPCYSLSLPTTACKTGGKLRGMDSSVCSRCYAHMRGNYSWPTVCRAQDRRLNKIQHVLACGVGSTQWHSWVDAMSKLLSREAYFRWHDSGDLQSVDHLRLIVDTCLQTPHVIHRLPTKEYGMVSCFLDEVGFLPNNLVIQLSSPMIDHRREFNSLMSRARFQVATVYSSAAKAYDDGKQFICPATTKRRTCDDCRACWDSSITNVSYMLH